MPSSLMPSSLMPSSLMPSSLMPSTSMSSSLPPLLPSSSSLLLLLLLHLPFSIALSRHSPVPSSSLLSLCSHRCHRLLQRSLTRLDPALDTEEVLYRIGTFRKTQMLSHGIGSSEEIVLPADQFRPICWKFIDFENCQRQCQKVYKKKRRRRGGEHDPDSVEIEPEQRVVLHFCHRVDLGVSWTHLDCIHKFHSFMEFHCSSYQQKAVQLRLIAFQLEQPDLDFSTLNISGQGQLVALKRAILQDICLLLHQHSACLANAGHRHCPRAAEQLLSARTSLRDHFLSLLLPFGTATEQRTKGVGRSSAPLGQDQLELDQLFPDSLLDHCQLIDFQRMAKEWMDQEGEEREKKGKEREKKKEREEKEEQGLLGRSSSTTKRALGDGTTTTSSSGEEGEGEEVTVAPFERRVFSSEEDLTDVPPNFHYSTARLPKDFYTRYAIWWGGRQKAAEDIKNFYPPREDSFSSEEQVIELLPTRRTAPIKSVNGKGPITLSQQQQQIGTTRPMQTLANKAKLKPIVFPQRSQKEKEEGKKTTTTTAAAETEGRGPLAVTGPDSTLLSTPIQIQQLDREEGQQIFTGSGGEGWTAKSTLPYLVNGHATVPVERWPGELGRTSGRPVIRLMDDREEGQVEPVQDEERTTLVRGNGRKEDSTTTTITESAEDETEENEEYRTEYGNDAAYYPEDYYSSSQSAYSGEDERERGGRQQNARQKGLMKAGGMDGLSATTSREGMMDSAQREREMPSLGAGNGGEQQQQQQFPVPPPPLLLLHTPEPMLRETNIYFAKILHFDETPDKGGEEKESIIGTAIKKIVQMEHSPGEQLASFPNGGDGAQLDYVVQEEERQSEEHQNEPFEIRPADLSQFLTGWKNGAASRPSFSPTGPPILVSAEPIPPKQSETLLVLLGVYLTFFAVAAFLLLCLVLACLERGRRTRSGQAKAGMGGTGAILYLDPKKGTVKDVI